jgi:antitoxin HigA-1
MIKSFADRETERIFARERSHKLPITAFASTTSGVSASNGVTATLIGSRSRIITRRGNMGKDKLAPVHPGEVLLEEFLKPLGLSQTRLAVGIGVHPRRINEIVLKKRRVTAETALRLARYFGVSPQFWLGLQAQYDLDVTEDTLGDRIEREVREHHVTG